MLNSIPLTENGTLVAVAARGEDGWFLIALDARLEELDRQGFPDARAAERAARSRLARRAPPPRDA